MTSDDAYYLQKELSPDNSFFFYDFRHCLFILSLSYIPLISILTLVLYLMHSSSPHPPEGMVGSLVTLVLWWRRNDRSSYKLVSSAGGLGFTEGGFGERLSIAIQGAMPFSLVLCNFLVASHELASGIYVDN